MVSDYNAADPDYQRLREIWRGIRKRCNNPKNHDYAHYHGRGITMCAEWANDFFVFYRWALAHGYRYPLTLDRVSNNRGYNPGNCRWVTRKQQALNRSTNTRLTVNGRTRTISQWSEESGTPDYTICRRMESGWTAEEAIFKPSRLEKKEER